MNPRCVTAGEWGRARWRTQHNRARRHGDAVPRDGTKKNGLYFSLKERPTKWMTGELRKKNPALTRNDRRRDDALPWRRRSSKWSAIDSMRAALSRQVPPLPSGRPPTHYNFIRTRALSEYFPHDSSCHQSLRVDRIQCDWAPTCGIIEHTDYRLKTR